MSCYNNYCKLALIFNTKHIYIIYIYIYIYIYIQEYKKTFSIKMKEDVGTEKVCKTEKVCEQGHEVNVGPKIKQTTSI